MPGTNLREITRALAHRIKKCRGTICETSISSGHLEMTKAIHCHFLKVQPSPPDRYEWQTEEGLSSYRHPYFSYWIKEQQTKTSTRVWLGCLVERVPELKEEVSQSHHSASKEAAWQEVIEATGTTMKWDPFGILSAPYVSEKKSSS